MTVPGLQNAASATVALVAVSSVHAQIRHRLVLRRLHTGWCPAHCFTTAMQDSLRKVSPLSSPLHTYETDQQVTCSSAQYTCALAAQHLSKRIRLDSVPAPCTAFHTCDVRCAEAKGIH